MDHKIDPARMTLVLKAAQAYSFFLGIAYGQDDDLPVGGRNWSLGAAASADVAFESASEFLDLCDWTNQPRMRAAIKKLIKDRYHYPFTEPEHMAVSVAGRFVGRIAWGLSAAVEVDSLTDEDFALLLCAFQILESLWTTTDCWNSETLGFVAELGLYFPESAWLRAAGIDVALDYRRLFRHCSAKQIDRLFDPAVRKPDHGFKPVQLLVVRRLRSLGVERDFRSEIEAMQNPGRNGGV